jgi:hypothetical protein
MSPRRIAEAASAHSLDLIALTDHNSAENCPAMEEACRRAGIPVIYGIEICTREEIHALCLFETASAAGEFGATIYKKIPFGKRSRYTKDQIIVDKDEVVLGSLDKFLITGADISFEESLDLTVRSGGLFIPAHVDRISYSVLSQIGYLPDLPYHGIELLGDRKNVETGKNTVIKNSDAHVPAHIGQRYFLFEGAEPSFGCLEAALLDGAVELP